MMRSLEDVKATLTAPGQLFEMDEVEIRGTRTRVWKNALPSLRSLLEVTRLHGDTTFLVYEDDRLTFEEHFLRAATFARRLTERYGVGKGDRVAIAMRNFPEWSVAFFGAAAVGAVVVPLNAWWTAPELEYGLRDSGAKVLVARARRRRARRSSTRCSASSATPCRRSPSTRTTTQRSSTPPVRPDARKARSAPSATSPATR
jgi:long-chain acyl-CoA synthetase